MSAKVGVVLSGCGVMDGSEIHEAVCTLLEIARNDAEAICLAPDIPQSSTVDHSKNQSAGEGRNVLVESARIARGKIRPVSQVQAAELDALILPGGFGAVTNLCDFASRGVDCSVQPDLERLLLDMHEAGKPIGALCIAPALLARVFGRAGVRLELTVGSDGEVGGKIEAMGARHVERKVGEIAVDAANKVVSTPAYMLGQRIDEVATGIALLVREVVRLAR